MVHKVLAAALSLVSGDGWDEKPLMNMQYLACFPFPTLPLYFAGYCCATRFVHAEALLLRIISFRSMDEFL